MESRSLASSRTRTGRLGASLHSLSVAGVRFRLCFPYIPSSQRFFLSFRFTISHDLRPLAWLTPSCRPPRSSSTSPAAERHPRSSYLSNDPKRHRPDTPVSEPRPARSALKRVGLRPRASPTARSPIGLPLPSHPGSPSSSSAVQHFSVRPSRTLSASPLSPSENCRAGLEPLRRR